MSDKKQPQPTPEYRSFGTDLAAAAVSGASGGIAGAAAAKIISTATKPKDKPKKD